MSACRRRTALVAAAGGPCFSAAATVDGFEELFSGPMLVIVPVVGMAVILAFVAVCFGGFRRDGSAPGDSKSISR